jgi:long-chain fatty acid transport protein
LLRRFAIAVALVPLLGVGSAWAGGFNIYEMGTRATALGGAFTATADDASALFYNPAALAWQDSRWEASGNLSLIFPNAKYARADGVEILYPGDERSETKDAVFPPGGAYLSYRMKKHPVAFGLGVFTPFGLGIEWDKPETFAGRPLATNSQIQGYYVSPMVAWAPSDMFAVSAGLHVVKTHLTLERYVTLPLGQNVGEFKLEGSSNWSVGAAAGVMVKPTDELSLGLNYKGGVKNEFRDQDANLDFFSGAAGIASSVSGDLEFPTIVAGGVRYQFTRALAGEFDLVWFQWSVFDEVALDFEYDPFDTVLEENYEDVVQSRAGLEYQLNEAWRIMGGFVYDNTPQPVNSISPLLPDADRLDYSAGFTWSREAWELSAAYMLVDFKERSTIEGGEGQNPEGFDGTYRSIAHIFSFGVSYDF